MIRYAVIDTNVLVSAMLKENSVPRKVINAAFNGKIIPLFDDEILREYAEVISRPKFKNTPQSIEFFLNGMKDHGKYIDAKDFEDALPDPKDVIFYRVVMTAREDVDAYCRFMLKTSGRGRLTFALSPRSTGNLSVRVGRES